MSTPAHQMAGDARMPHTPRPYDSGNDDSTLGTPLATPQATQTRPPRYEPYPLLQTPSPHRQQEAQQQHTPGFEQGTPMTPAGDLLNTLGTDLVFQFATLQFSYYKVSTRAAPWSGRNLQALTNHSSRLSFPLACSFLTPFPIALQNDRCYELDQQLGDVHSSIVEREGAVVCELERLALEAAPALLEVAAAAAELDCLLALADVARQYRLVRPVLDERPGAPFRIVGGRHLLQELCVPVFIANDLDMASAEEVSAGVAARQPIGGELPSPQQQQQQHRPAGSVKLLFGPNSSGKSIYLKQCGLIAYLAHIGSFVPAVSAHVPLMDRIMTRMATRESALLVRDL